MIFLDYDDVLRLHDKLIADYGGKMGLRDKELLTSALAQPRQSFGGVPTHLSIFDKAAAYFFHLSQNHPFIDGNKRSALVSALTFLHINGCSICFPPDALEEMAWKVASGERCKKQIASFLACPLEMR